MKMKEKYTKLFAYTKKCLYLCISFREERQFEKSNMLESLRLSNFDKVNRLFRLVVIDLGF